MVISEEKCLGTGAYVGCTSDVLVISSSDPLILYQKFCSGTADGSGCFVHRVIMNPSRIHIL